jgi:uncharacterized protein DUF3987
VSQLSQSQPDDFPTGVLPPRVFLFVVEAAEALGVDRALVAGPCLATLAGCIGNRRRIVIKPGAWVEACVLWIATVMRSGGRKTPANGLVLEHLYELEAGEIEKTAPMNESGEAEALEPRRLLVSDTTVEALLSVHARAPLGLLLHRDELAGWIRGFNQYKGGKGSDAQTWTELHQGRPCIIDRKVSGTLSVPRAAVSIVGGVQPELLREALSGEHLYDGVASRVLFVAPPEQPKRWTEKTVCDEVRAEWTGLLDELLALQPNEDGTPIDLPMSARAREVWVRYYNEHAQREVKEHGPLRAAMSKLEATTARLALVIQLASDPQSIEVDFEAVEAGIKLSNWFEGQARRVYQEFEETQQEKDRWEVRDWIAKKGGGKITKRQLAHDGPGRFRKRVREVLEDLVDAGLAIRMPQPGKRGDEYMLCDSDSCDAETE